MMMQPQFNVGEKAVYPTHGVAEVVALETKVIEGNIKGLKQFETEYRARLTEGVPSVRFVYLRISKELARQRITARAASGHYMPAALIDSQFAALEEPTEPSVLTLDASQPLAQLLAQAQLLLPAGS